MLITLQTYFPNKTLAVSINSIRSSVFQEGLNASFSAHALISTGSLLSLTTGTFLPRPFGKIPRIGLHCKLVSERSRFYQYGLFSQPFCHICVR